MKIRLWPTTSKVRASPRPGAEIPPQRLTDADLLSGEGDQEESWPVEEAHSEDEQTAQSTDFAPRGASRFQDRVRNKLPKPLDLKNTRQGVVVEKLYGACSVRSPH
jgi:hypothetical protein